VQEVAKRIAATVVGHCLKGVAGVDGRYVRAELFELFFGHHALLVQASPICQYRFAYCLGFGAGDLPIRGGLRGQEERCQKDGDERQDDASAGAKRTVDGVPRFRVISVSVRNSSQSIYRAFRGGGPVVESN
jgi:hypothetical protein